MPVNVLKYYCFVQSTLNLKSVDFPSRKTKKNKLEKCNLCLNRTVFFLGIISLSSQKTVTDMLYCRSLRNDKTKGNSYYSSIIQYNVILTVM